MKIKPYILKPVAYVIILSFLIQDIAWANPDIATPSSSALQAPTRLQPVISRESFHRTLLEFPIKTILKSTDIETFGYRLTPRLTGNLNGLQLDLDFSPPDEKIGKKRGKLRREDGWVIPCTVLDRSTGRQWQYEVFVKDDKSFVVKNSEPGPSNIEKEASANVTEKKPYSWYVGTEGVYSDSFDRPQMTQLLKESYKAHRTVIISNGRYIKAPTSDDDFDYLGRLEDAGNCLRRIKKLGRDSYPLKDIEIVLIEKVDGDIHRLAEMMTGEAVGDYVYSACTRSEDGSVRIYSTKALFKDLTIGNIGKHVLSTHIDQLSGVINDSYSDEIQGHVLRRIHGRLVETVLGGIRNESKIFRAIEKYFKGSASKAAAYLEFLSFIMEKSGVSVEEKTCYSRVGRLYAVIETIVWPSRLLLWLVMPLLIPVFPSLFIPVYVTLVFITSTLGTYMRFIGLTYLFVKFRIENGRWIPMGRTFLLGLVPFVGSLGLLEQILSRASMPHKLRYIGKLKSIGDRLSEIIDMAEFSAEEREDLKRHRFYLADSIYKFQGEDKLKILSTYYSEDKLDMELSDAYQKVKKNIGVLVLGNASMVNGLKEKLLRRYGNDRRSLDMFYVVDVNAMLDTEGRRCYINKLFTDISSIEGYGAEKASRKTADSTPRDAGLAGIFTLLIGAIISCSVDLFTVHPSVFPCIFAIYTGMTSLLIFDYAIASSLSMDTMEANLKRDTGPFSSFRFFKDRRAVAMADLVTGEVAYNEESEKNLESRHKIISDYHEFLHNKLKVKNHIIIWILEASALMTYIIPLAIARSIRGKIARPKKEGRQPDNVVNAPEFQVTHVESTNPFRVSLNDSRARINAAAVKLGYPGMEKGAIAETNKALAKRRLLESNIAWPIVLGNIFVVLSPLIAAKVLSLTLLVVGLTIDAVGAILLFIRYMTDTSYRNTKIGSAIEKLLKGVDEVEAELNKAGVLKELTEDIPVAMITKYEKGGPGEKEPLMGTVGLVSLKDLIQRSRSQLKALGSGDNIGLNQRQIYELLRRGRSGPPSIWESVKRRATSRIPYNGRELEVYKLFRALEVAETIARESDILAAREEGLSSSKIGELVAKTKYKHYIAMEEMIKANELLIHRGSSAYKYPLFSLWIFNIVVFFAPFFVLYILAPYGLTYMGVHGADGGVIGELFGAIINLYAAHPSVPAIFLTVSLSISVINWIFKDFYISPAGLFFNKETIMTQSGAISARRGVVNTPTKEMRDFILRTRESKDEVSKLLNTNLAEIDRLCRLTGTDIGKIDEAALVDMILSAQNIYKIGGGANAPPRILVDELFNTESVSVQFPIYTIALPAFGEPAVIEELIDSISNLIYPRDKLDIILLPESSDAFPRKGEKVSTLELIRKKLTSDPIRYANFTVLTSPIRVPDEHNQAKPYSTNYLLGIMQGKYLVIYDAEDRPYPLQVVEALVGFENRPAYLTRLVKYITQKTASGKFDINKIIIDDPDLYRKAIEYRFDIRSIADYIKKHKKLNPDNTETEIVHDVSGAYLSYSKLGVLQAPLTWYNPVTLTATQFILDYGTWFGIFLPGLEAKELPVSHGGTSNHFLARILKEVGGWDPHNVTEDAQIAGDIQRLGYKSLMLASVTAEEAPTRQITPKKWVWVGQHSRWGKGFVQVFLVFLRNLWMHPADMYRVFGLRGIISNIFLFGVGTYSYVFTTLFVTTTFLWGISNLIVMGPVWAVSVVSFVVLMISLLRGFSLTKTSLLLAGTVAANILFWNIVISFAHYYLMMIPAALPIIPALAGVLHAPPFLVGLAIMFAPVVTHIFYNLAAAWIGTPHRDFVMTTTINEMRLRAKAIRDKDREEASVIEALADNMETDPKFYRNLLCKAALLMPFTYRPFSILSFWLGYSQFLKGSPFWWDKTEHEGRGASEDSGGVMNKVNGALKSIRHRYIALSSKGKPGFFRFEWGALAFVILITVFGLTTPIRYIRDRFVEDPGRKITPAMYSKEQMDFLSKFSDEYSDYDSNVTLARSYYDAIMRTYADSPSYLRGRIEGLIKDHTKDKWLLSHDEEVKLHILAYMDITINSIGSERERAKALEWFLEDLRISISKYGKYPVRKNSLERTLDSVAGISSEVPRNTPNWLFQFLRSPYDAEMRAAWWRINLLDRMPKKSIDFTSPKTKTGKAGVGKFNTTILGMLMVLIFSFAVQAGEFFTYYSPSGRMETKRMDAPDAYGKVYYHFIDENYYGRGYGRVDAEALGSPDHPNIRGYRYNYSDSVRYDVTVGDGSTKVINGLNHAFVGFGGASHSSIQAAIDEVYNTGGGFVVVREGSYDLNGSQLIVRDGVRLFGGYSPSGLRDIQNYPTNIRNGYIDAIGPITKTTEINGLNIGYDSDFSGRSARHLIGADTKGGTGKVLITNNSLIADTTIGFGIEVVGSVSQAVIFNNRISGSDGSSKRFFWAGVHVADGADAVSEFNRISTFYGSGVTVNGSITPTRATIRNNLFNNNGSNPASPTHALLFDAFDTYVWDNTFDGGDSAVTYKDADNIKIENNIMDSQTGQPIFNIGSSAAYTNGNITGSDIDPADYPGKGYSPARVYNDYSSMGFTKYAYTNAVTNDLSNPQFSGLVRIYEYDSDGRMVKQINSDGSYSEFVDHWDGTGKIKTQNDRAENGDLLARTDYWPDGCTVHSRIDYLTGQIDQWLYGNIYRKLVWNGSSYHGETYKNGHLIIENDPAAGIKVYNYDSSWNFTGYTRFYDAASTNGLGKRVKEEYDQQYRITKKYEWDEPFHVGVSLPWLDYGKDIGKSHALAAQPVQRGLSTKREQLDENLRGLAGTVCRPFVLCDLRSGLDIDGRGNILGFDEESVSDLRELLNSAQANGVKLILTIFDYTLAEGVTGARYDNGHGTIIEPLGEFRSFITDNAKREQLKSAVLDLFNRAELSRYSCVIGFDIMNEPEWSRDGLDYGMYEWCVYDPNWSGVPQADLESFFVYFKDALHTAYPGKWVTVGHKDREELSSWSGTNDMYQFHYYDWMASSPPHQPLDAVDASELGLSGPVFAGELDPTDVTNKLNVLYDGGYAMGLFWRDDGSYQMPTNTLNTIKDYFVGTIYEYDNNGNITNIIHRSRPRKTKKAVSSPGGKALSAMIIGLGLASLGAASELTPILNTAGIVLAIIGGIVNARHTFVARALVRLVKWLITPSDFFVSKTSRVKPYNEDAAKLTVVLKELEEINAEFARRSKEDRAAADLIKKKMERSRRAVHEENRLLSDALSKIYEEEYTKRPDIRALIFKNTGKGTFLPSSDSAELLEIFAVLRIKRPDAEEFFDFGSGDGRVAMLAAISGFKASGMEWSAELTDFSKGVLNKLEAKIKELGIDRSLEVSFTQGNALDGISQDKDIIFFSLGGSYNLSEIQDRINGFAKENAVIVVHHPKEPLAKLKPLYEIMSGHSSLFEEIEGKTMLYSPVRPALIVSSELGRQRVYEYPRSGDGDGPGVWDDMKAKPDSETVKLLRDAIYSMGRQGKVPSSRNLAEFSSLDIRTVERHRSDPSVEKAIDLIHKELRGKVTRAKFALAGKGKIVDVASLAKESHVTPEVVRWCGYFDQTLSKEPVVKKPEAPIASLEDRVDRLKMMAGALINKIAAAEARGAVAKDDPVFLMKSVVVSRLDALMLEVFDINRRTYWQLRKLRDTLEPPAKQIAEDQSEKGRLPDYAWSGAAKEDVEMEEDRLFSELGDKLYTPFYEEDLESGGKVIPNALRRAEQLYRKIAGKSADRAKNKINVYQLMAPAKWPAFWSFADKAAGESAGFNIYATGFHFATPYYILHELFAILDFFPHKLNRILASPAKLLPIWVRKVIYFAARGYYRKHVIRTDNSAGSPSSTVEEIIERLSSPKRDDETMGLISRTTMYDFMTHKALEVRKPESITPLNYINGDVVVKDRVIVREGRLAIVELKDQERLMTSQLYTCSALIARGKNAAGRDIYALAHILPQVIPEESHAVANILKRHFVGPVEVYIDGFREEEWQLMRLLDIVKLELSSVGARPVFDPDRNIWRVRGEVDDVVVATSGFKALRLGGNQKRKWQVMALPGTLETDNLTLSVHSRENPSQSALKVAGIQLPEGDFLENTKTMEGILRTMAKWGEWKPDIVLFPESMDDIGSIHVDTSHRLNSLQLAVEQTGISVGYFLENDRPENELGGFNMTYNIIRPGAPFLTFRKFRDDSENRVFDINGMKAALLICVESQRVIRESDRNGVGSHIKDADVILVAAGTNMPGAVAWPRDLSRKYRKPTVFVNFGGGKELSRPSSSFVFGVEDGVSSRIELSGDSVLYADVQQNEPGLAEDIPVPVIDDAARAKAADISGEEAYLDTAAASETERPEVTKPPATQIAATVKATLASFDKEGPAISAPEDSVDGKQYSLLDMHTTRDLTNENQLVQTMVEKILSIALTKKVVLAFDPRLGGMNSAKIRAVFDVIEELKKDPKFEKFLRTRNIEVLPNLNKVKDFAWDSGAEVFVFTGDKVGVPESGNIHTAIVDERGFPMNAYYPLAEIVAITLSNFLDSSTLPKAIAIAKKLNIDSIIASDGILVFTLLPNADELDMQVLVKRYAILKDLLRNA